MLGDCNIRPEIGVKDLQRAKEFYANVLGLKVISENEQAVLFASGNGELSLYRSDFAGTNQATYASWECDDVATIAGTLKDKGVVFEHYEIADVEHRGDVHVFGKMHIAWFKDVDGNILCIANHPQ